MGPAVSASCCNDYELAVQAMFLAVNNVLPLTQDDVTTRDDRLSVPWITFVDNILPQAIPMTARHKVLNPAPGRRTIDDMLTRYDRLAMQIDPQFADAVARLSSSNANEIVALKNYVLTTSLACRCLEMEAVYWPTRLWEEALKEDELFIDTPVLQNYLPDGPQLWYFEETLQADLNPDAAKYEWASQGWKLSCLALHPHAEDGFCACIALYENELPAGQSEFHAASTDHLLPRASIHSFGRTNTQC